jgi:hypothetical protein
LVRAKNLLRNPSRCLVVPQGLYVLAGAAGSPMRPSTTATPG